MGTDDVLGGVSPYEHGRLIRTPLSLVVDAEIEAESIVFSRLMCMSLRVLARYILYRGAKILSTIMICV